MTTQPSPARTLTRPSVRNSETAAGQDGGRAELSAAAVDTTAGPEEESDGGGMLLSDEPFALANFLLGRPHLAELITLAQSEALYGSALLSAALGSAPDGDVSATAPADAARAGWAEDVLDDALGIEIRAGDDGVVAVAAAAEATAAAGSEQPLELGREELEVAEGLGLELALVEDPALEVELALEEPVLSGIGVRSIVDLVEPPTPVVVTDLDCVAAEAAAEVNTAAEEAVAAVAEAADSVAAAEVAVEAAAVAAAEVAAEGAGESVVAGLVFAPPLLDV